MKKIIFFVPIFVFATQIMMPPPIPNIDSKPTKIKTQPKEIKECKTIPPMLIFMPPPLEKDLIICKNKKFMPTLKQVKAKFPKLKIKSIDYVKGFIELYVIDTNKGKIYCNKDLSKCFKGIQWIKTK